MEALEAASEAGIVNEQVGALNPLGVIANARGERDRSERHLLEAMRLAEADRNLELAHTAQLNLGIT